VLERRNEPADRTKAIARSSLERLFRREDVAIREKCLWRLLYETAARTQEVLCADIEDLDLENKLACACAARAATATGCTFSLVQRAYCPD
jgi:integrase